MSETDYLEHKLRDKKSTKNAVKELDAYILNEEKRFGIINVSDSKSTCQPKLFKMLLDLKYALEKNKCEREEAYEYLKKSNKTMRKIMEKLKEEIKYSHENIHNEFINFENLSTDRLLNINPKSFFKIDTERGK